MNKSGIVINLKSALFKKHQRKLVNLATCLLCLFIHIDVYSQEQEIIRLEKSLDSVFGIEKVKRLNQLVLLTNNSVDKSSYKFAKRAANLSDNILETSSSIEGITSVAPFINAYYNLAIADYSQGDFIDAKYGFQKAIELNEANKLSLHKKSSIHFLDSIQYKIDIGEVKENKFRNKLNNLKIGKGIKDVARNIDISTEIRFAENKVENGNLGGAIDNYKSAINLLKDIGDSKRINELQLIISDLLTQLNQNQEAQAFLDEAIIEKQQEKPKPTQIDSNTISRDRVKVLADSFAQAKDYLNSAKYYGLFNELSKKIIEDSLKAQLAQEQKSQEILLLKQQKKIADLHAESSTKEKEKQVRLRNMLFIISILIIVIAGLILYFFIQKKKEHNKLNKTYKDLKSTKDELEIAEQQITTLLKQQVSGDIAKQLIYNKTQNMADKHFVCVLFLDIRNFTVRAEQLSPEELIDFQNEVFSFMIDCVEEKHGNINQLLGDGFMATFGAPISHGNDCLNAFEASQNILDKLKEKISNKDLPAFRIGIGLHAGDVVTGNVGNESRKQYSVTGNPVIIASRIEQLNKEFNSQFIISETVFNELDKEDNFVSKVVKLKGRSDETTVYIVE